MAEFSTNYTKPNLKLSACASNLNSTTECAHTAQKTSSQNQVARNAAMRGGGEAPGRITVSQGPSSAAGTVSASPVNANTNMVTTTKASVGGQAQTQYDSDVDTSGVPPESSSPRPKSQTGGGSEEGEKYGSWLNRLNKSGGGKKRGRRKVRHRTQKRGRRKGRRRTQKRGRRKGRRRTQKHRKKRKKTPKKKSSRSRSPDFRKIVLAAINKWKKNNPQKR